MNRPWIIWSLSAVCALLVFGAMGLITRHTLNLENERAQAEAKAEFEGWVRLAMWRMDTSAAGILAEENSRPPSHFRDVHLPESHPQASLQVNDNVKLHFEVQNGVISSPKKSSEWGSFTKRLNDESSQLVQSKQKKQVKDYGDNNLDVIRAVAKGNSELKVADPNWDAQVEVAKEQRAAHPNESLRNSTSYQSNYNRAEKVRRQAIVNKSVGNISGKGGQILQQVADKEVEAPADQSGAVVADPSPQLAAAGVKAALLADSGIKPMADGGQEFPLSPLTPMWLDQDLILVREVVDQSGKRVQGVWLNASSIEKSLLMDINDLLPDAQLQPVRRGIEVLLGELPDPDEEDPMVMAALPWRLIPGEMKVADPVGWTPIRKTLGVAWVGAVFAALAALVLLRGVVKLSERRASFVSSVTHELRTPLTTFSLYSDMLAEGMVKDEQKQLEYLLTLRRESARLTHLVENVLAYSQIERGSARAQVVNVRVGDLVGRMEDRLRQRAEEAGMDLVVNIPDELSSRSLEVDTTAVEQIIFNLVDNAGKYAGGDGCGKKITLEVVSGSSHKEVAIRVCDQGPGIKVSERRRLFRAFHKSARDAAHSKPGVGLGLALSRRLARALGGDLKIIPCKQGACFELRLKS